MNIKGKLKPILDGRRDDSQMTLRRTRTATRRSGDDYQDLVAAKAMLTFLRNPSLFRWIKLEAREAGKLDDVVVLRVDGTVEATQVKFSSDILRTGDPLTWKDLLRRGNQGKSLPLIKQWWDSVTGLDKEYGRTEPILFSNRRAGDDLFLTATGRIDVDKTRSDVLEQIKALLGDNADNFMDRFRFEVNEQGLTDLEERLQREFRSLGLPETNWLGFMNAIRSWIRCENLPPNGELRISDLRLACGWTQLSPLNQDLKVPADYVLSDKDCHQNFLQQLIDGNEPVIVLTAGPGIGKSTYLSYLVDQLQESDCPVVRHHYSLGPGRDSLERVESHRIAESLMADLQIELRPYLAALDTQNPNSSKDLPIWLKEVGERLSAEGKHLIVVIDGLDHVWRARDSRDELTKLFEQLLPAPPGVVLVVGTQPVQDTQLPASLLSYAPRNSWHQLPPLDKPAVREWLDHHHNLMPSQWSEGNPKWHLVRLAESLHRRTGGHPLLVRYTVERIAGAGKYLSWDEVESIPEPPASSVEEYYRSFWTNLPLHARDVMFLFAVARFRWPLTGLHETLRLAGYDQANGAAGVDAVRHLLWNNRIGLQPFHNSVLLFALEQPEFESRRDELRQAAITWLTYKAPAYLRRSNLWLLQREAGDPKPLMEGTDRQWVVEAITASDSLADIEHLLQEAAYESIKALDFPKFVDRGILADVVEHTVPIQYDALRWVFEAQLAMEGGEELAARQVARLSELNDAAVASLGSYSKGMGNSFDAQECFDLIRRRLNWERNDFQISEENKHRPEILSELAGLIAYDSRSIVRFINQFSSETAQASLVDSWIVGLRNSGGRRSAIEALRESTGSLSKRCLSRYVAVDSISEGIRLSEAETESLVSPYPSVYQILRDPNASVPVPVDPAPPVDEWRLAIDEYAQDVGHYVHDLFFCWLVQELQSPGQAKHWTPPADVQPWLKSSLRALALGAEEIAAQWHLNGTVAVTSGYNATQCLDYPPFQVPFANRQCADGLKRALCTIAEDLLVFRRATGGSSTLSWEEVQSLVSHQFAGSRSIIEWIAEGTLPVDDKVAISLCNLVDNECATTTEPFGDRAAALAMLATICARHQQPTRAHDYLRQASENLVAYGYHKDILLDTALNVIEVVGEHLDSRLKVWARLAPAIGAVRQFTDGDETNHLISKLGRLLLDLDPDLAVAYLTFLMDNEQYSDVQQVLKELVSTGDLNAPDVRAIVKTCIDPDSIELLERRAGQAYEPAAQALPLMPRYSSRFSRENVERLMSSSSEEDTHGWTPKNDSSPEKCLEYPPEDLDGFIQREGSDGPYWLSQSLCTWLCCWAKTDRARDAVEAVRPYLLDDDRFRVSNEAVNAAKQIVGRTQSFGWLVKANRSNHGWYEHWTKIGEARERWCWLKHDFPDRWHEFLIASITPDSGYSWHFGMTVARLAEYLRYFDHSEDSYAVARQLVDTVVDLTSGQLLPKPSWIAPDSEDQ